MEKKINELVLTLQQARNLEPQISDKEYWINRAKEEAGFVPREGDWIHVEVTLWHIRVSVYHKYTDHRVKESRYWLNGEWFDTPFPEKYPYLSDMKF